MMVPIWASLASRRKVFCTAPGQLESKSLSDTPADTVAAAASTRPNAMIRVAAELIAIPFVFGGDNTRKSDPRRAGVDVPVLRNHDGMTCPQRRRPPFSKLRTPNPACGNGRSPDALFRRNRPAFRA